jgi:UDP-N-acetylglucosamine--N-acetylmuramyl-(pentapeptide) pyrophosphoryl-undecaprenol N-acetylglucosamine transferase
MINRIIFAAGGTGGHIYPAIAVADELKKVNENIKIKFIGAKGKIEEKIIPANGYELETIDIIGFKRSLSLKNLTAVYKLFIALKVTKKILRGFAPDLVFGTGGYVSGPVLKSAAKLSIKTAVHEGNYYPGITVKLLSGYADKVIVNFAGTKKYLKRNDNVTVMPYPVRKNLVKIPKDEAQKIYGLDKGKRTLFVFGGSQGAASINSALLKCLKNLLAGNLQVIWQTGENDFDTISKLLDTGSSVKLFRYIDNINTAYSAADLILCRAGISTIMELAVLGMAAVFVPYPLAAENHQEKNVQALVDKNAAIMISDKMLNAKLETTIGSLIYDEKSLEKMRFNIRQFADKEAASKIADLLIGMNEN